MNKVVLYSSIRILEGSVFFVFGLFGKLLFPERHTEIVETILQQYDQPGLVPFIGFGEILMAVWIFSGWHRSICLKTQIVLILLMNSLEFVFARDLLLFGPFNLVFAVLYCFIIYWNEEIFNPKRNQYASIT